MGPAGNRRRRHRQRLRGQLQPLLGGEIREEIPPNERFVDQALRHQPHRQLQRFRDDCLSQSSQPPPQIEPPTCRSRLRLHRRHLRRALRLLRRRGNPLHRYPPRKQDLHGAARAAHRKRCLRAQHRHRFRRLHETNPPNHDGAADLSGEFTQQPEIGRAEDGGDRNPAAIQLGSPRLGDRPRRKPRQHLRILQRIQNVPRIRSRGSNPAPRLRAGAQCESFVPSLQLRVERVQSDEGGDDVRLRDSNRGPCLHRQSGVCAAKLRRNRGRGDGGGADGRHGAGGFDGDVRLPAHRRCAVGIDEAEGEWDDRGDGSDGGGEHGARVEVHAGEDRLPLRQDSGDGV